MSSTHDPLTGASSPLNFESINIVDTNDDSRQVCHRRQLEVLGPEMRAAPASNHPSDEPELLSDLNLNPEKLFEKPFHGVPVEVRLIIWEYIIMPDIKIVEQSPDQAQALSFEVLRSSSWKDCVEPDPKLHFDPPLTTLTSLQATSRIMRAEVSHVLEKYGVTIDVGFLQAYSIKTLLRRFDRPHAPHIAVLRMQARQLRSPAAGHRSFTCAFEMDGNKLHSAPMLTRLDFVIDTNLSYVTALELADIEEDILLAASNGDPYEIRLGHALIRFGYSMAHTRELLSSGFIEEIKLIFQNCQSNEVKFLRKGFEKISSIPGLSQSRAASGNASVPDHPLSRTRTFTVSLKRESTTAAKNITSEDDGSE